MAALADAEVLATFESRVSPWGASQAVRVPKSALAAARTVRTGTLMRAELGIDDAGEYILMRPAEPQGAITLGLARDRGLALPFDDDLFDALDEEILSMFGDA